MKVLGILIIIIIINNLFMCVYCKFKDKHDAKLRKNKKKDTSVTSSKLDENTSVVPQKNGKHLKHMLIKVYQKMDHYLYGLMRYEIILTGKIPSYRIRNFIYRVIFQMKASSKSVIFGGCEFRSPWNIHMDNCVISNGCVLDGRNEIFIGDNVVFGSNVHVWTEEHDMNDPMFGIGEFHAQPVYFKDRTWICSDSTILPGVVIEEGAVVASRACVTKNCEAYGVYGGVPAKRIGTRNNELKYVLNGKPHWHFY